MKFIPSVTLSSSPSIPTFSVSFLILNEFQSVIYRQYSINSNTGGSGCQIIIVALCNVFYSYALNQNRPARVFPLEMVQFLMRSSFIWLKLSENARRMSRKKLGTLGCSEFHYISLNCINHEIHTRTHKIHNNKNLIETKEKKW